MRSCAWTCVTWSTCVETDTGGSWQLISTLTTRCLHHVPATRAKQSPRSGGQNDFATSSGVCQLSVTRLGIHPATRVFGQQMKFHGELGEHGEFFFHSNVVDKRPAGKTFYHSGISARGLGKTCRLASNEKNRYLGRGLRRFDGTSRSKWLV